MKTTAQVVVIGGGVVGCSDNPKGVTGEATVDARNKDLQANQRIMALEALWADASELALTFAKGLEFPKDNARAP